MGYKTTEVFGISAIMKPISYVDRSQLDSRINKLLQRDTHIALKGASKCGKSWLRQKCVPDAIVVQCSFQMTISELYKRILRELGVEVTNCITNSTSYAGEMNGEANIGIPLVGNVKTTVDGSVSRTVQMQRETLQSADDIKFIAEKINESGMRLIIEDFHYMHEVEREKFSRDLKTLWDYGCFVIIIGVWTQTNLLTYMNPDLSGRIEEVSVTWTGEDLREVIRKGSEALNISIEDSIVNELVKDSFGNVGILQKLLLSLVADESEIDETCEPRKRIYEKEKYIQAAQAYAGQLDGVYQQFALKMSKGIRQRRRSTGIYALTMQAIVDADDNKLCEGFKRSEIYSITHGKESRIQKGNLKTVLQKLGELQHNSYQGGLVVAYDESTDAVTVVDMQLLFYRKHHTMRWPWEEIADEAKQESLFDADDTELE